MKRSTTIFWIAVLVAVSFTLGLALSIRERTGTEIVMKLAGIMAVVSGVFLLTSRNVTRRQPEGPTGGSMAVEYVTRMRIRIVGASGVLLGASQFVPNHNTGTVLVLCAAAVSTGGVFKLPRRLFTLQGHAE